MYDIDFRVHILHKKFYSCTTRFLCQKLSLTFTTKTRSMLLITPPQSTNPPRNKAQLMTYRMTT